MLTSIPAEIRQKVSSFLNTELKSFSITGGGCINQGGRLKTLLGDFFLKWNDANKFPGMFESESKGLKLLRSADVVCIPKVITANETGSWQFILMEYVEGNSKSERYWQDLGRQLAALHQHSSNSFGLDHQNYIGSLSQYNTFSKNWVEFFISQRLQVQLQLAIDHNRIDAGIVKQFDALYKKLPTILPQEKPSLLHGDLWSGNLITNLNGDPCLIDPAVYYGHREAEIAFTMLFGGFSERFYENYQENFPLQPGFKQRSQVYNLYPLLVHVNLFGGGYLSQAVSILRVFV